MVKGILGGIIAVILIGIAAFLWNSLSDGGLVHAFGGVTSQELAQQIATPGPQGPAGPPRSKGRCRPSRTRTSAFINCSDQRRLRQLRADTRQRGLSCLHALENRLASEPPKS